MVGKRRRDGAHVEVGEVIGVVAGRPCVIVDDMITTGGTIVACADALRAAGATPGFLVAAVHGVLVAGAREALAAAGVRGLVLTDSIPLPAGAASPPTTVVPLAPLAAGVLRRLSARAPG